MLMDPEVANYMEERQAKQRYLKSEIQEKNYNVTEFVQFLEWKRGNVLALFLADFSSFLRLTFMNLI